MFESLINEVAERFGLGNKAETLLSALLSLITDEKRGGISGFLESFNRVGLGEVASSWVSRGANTALSTQQTEDALGADTISGIADKVGIPTATASSALSFIVPQVIDKLTPDGVVPDNKDLLSTLGSYLTGIGAAAVGAVSGAAGMVGDTVSGAANTVTGALGTGAKTVGAGMDYASNKLDDVTGGGGGGFLTWLIPLILLGLLLFLGYQFCGGPKQEVTKTPPVNTNTANVNKPTAPAVDSSLKIEAKDGKYTVSGVVPSEDVKKQIMEAMNKQYGEGNVNFDGLKVDTNAKPFATGWWDNFSKLLPSLKDWKTGTLAFVGGAITDAVGLPQAAIDAVKSLFSGWKLPLSLAGVEGATKQANEEALKNLESAKSVEEVVKALNVSIINFASGKSDIPKDAQTILQKAADVLKAQPEGTVIEVGGYTDNKGNAEGNKKLSQARADSVRKYLIGLGVKEGMLKAMGYGDANPVGDNNTEDGRFKNRRIEYKVVGGSGSTTATTTTTTTTTNTNAPSNTTSGGSKPPANAPTNAANTSK
jgi:outer membrane protein OmpA-like peptidoglycan-associated protein/uncharacterized protein YidB (DUF937 family)